MKQKLKAEKQKWKELDGKQKWQYFKDYYLIATCVIVAILIFAGNLIWTCFLKPEENTILYTAVIDDSLDEEKAEQVTCEVETLLGADGKSEQVFFDDGLYLDDSNSLMKLQVYISCGQIDVMIMDEDDFKEYAGNGTFISLDEVTEEDLQTKYGQEYVETAGYLETEDVSYEDNESGQGEVKPYGISLAGNNKYTDMASGYIENPVFAIVASSENTENALKLLDYFFE